MCHQNKPSSRTYRLFAISLCAVLLGACGGGGGSTDNGPTASQTPAPVAPAPVDTTASPSVPPTPAPSSPPEQAGSASVLKLVAGTTGGPGDLDGEASEARFSRPAGLARDGVGNLYVTDVANQRLVRITPTGKVTTVGYMELGGLTEYPWFSGIAVDRSGNIYAMYSGLLRKISSSGQILRTYSHVKSVRGLAVDVTGNLYITAGSTVRKVTPGGEMTILAGSEQLGGSADGAGAQARFDRPTGIAVASNGTLYVTEPTLQVVRKVTPTGMVTTLAGTLGSGGKVDGDGQAARFCLPKGITVDAADVIYVAESGGAIRRITPTGTVTSWGDTGFQLVASGSGCSLSAAYIDPPDQIVIDDAGMAYKALNMGGLTASGDVFDGGGTVLRINSNGASTYFAGLPREQPQVILDGSANTARFYNIDQVAAHSDGSLYVIDRQKAASVLSFSTVFVRKIDPSGEVTTVGGVGLDNYGLSDVVTDVLGNTYISKTTPHPTTIPFSHPYLRGGQVYKLEPSGAITTLWSSATAVPFGLALNKNGDLVINLGNGSFPIISSKTGESLGVFAAIDSDYTRELEGEQIRAMLINAAGDLVLATTFGITRIPAGSSMAVPSWVAGSTSRGYVDGSSVAARFSGIEALAQDAAGNIYAADTGNHAVRKIDPSGTVSTLIGGPTSQGIRVDAVPASLDSPRGLAVDRNGWLYISSAGAVLKYKLSP